MPIIFFLYYTFPKTFFLLSKNPRITGGFPSAAFVPPAACLRKSFPKTPRKKNPADFIKKTAGIFHFSYKSFSRR